MNFRKKKSHMHLVERLVLRLRCYSSLSVSFVSFSTRCVGFKEEDQVQTEPVVTRIVIYDSLIASFN